MMPIDLYRIDDRLIHGQVVVGWGQPMNTQFIVLVDDAVAASDLERELYSMGVPPGMEIIFANVHDAIREHARIAGDARHGILVVGDIRTMSRLVAGTGSIREVNIGGIHHRSGRTQKLRYVFLTPEEEDELRKLASTGVRITAQDVPTARVVPVHEMLGSGNPGAA